MRKMSVKPCLCLEALVAAAGFFIAPWFIGCNPFDDMKWVLIYTLAYMLSYAGLRAAIILLGRWVKGLFTAVVMLCRWLIDHICSIHQTVQSQPVRSNAVGENSGKLSREPLDCKDKITFLGVEGSGKTVLTSALINVFKAHEKDGWRLKSDSREAFRFMEQVPASLSGDALPHQTTTLKWLSWGVMLGEDRVGTFDILDYPGEVYRLAFLEEKDDPDPATLKERVDANKDDIKALLSHVADSSHVFVLFNLDDAKDLSTNAKNLDAVWVTNACIKLLTALPSRPQITLLLTQIDRYVDAKAENVDARKLVKDNLPMISDNYPNLDVLSISAIGDAKSAFGIDNLILRCLFNTKYIQDLSINMRDASEITKHWFSRFSLDSMLSIDDVECSLETTSNLVHMMPWFLPEEQLHSAGMVGDRGEPDDGVKIVEVLRHLEKILRQKDVLLARQTYQWALRRINEVRVTTNLGMDWKKQVISGLPVDVGAGVNKLMALGCQENVLMRLSSTVKDFRRNKK